MPKKFNITGLCHNNYHYMADISQKLAKTFNMVEDGDYFVINRPRQYGKTTMLHTLAHALQHTDKYVVLNASFEGIGDAVFETEAAFSVIFVKLLAKYTAAHLPDAADWLLESAPSTQTLDDVSKLIGVFIQKINKKVVLLIDEVDKSSNNQLFISFLAMLRNKYLERFNFPTFHAVVLAGVHDVKSLKIKLRADEEQKYNSPWNIAADYKVDMNLQVSEIIPMLKEYAADKGVEMNTTEIAERLFYYTSGYPFLVSKLCKMIDEEMLPEKDTNDWTAQDVQLAVQNLVKEVNPNFDTLIKNLENDPNLYDMVYEIVIENNHRPFNPHNPTRNFAILYGILAQNKHVTVIHNRIYQEVIVNYMTDKLQDKNNTRANNIDLNQSYKNDDKSLNMEAVMLGFQAFMKKEHNKKDRDFLEKHGRLVFLAFIKPIINGSGYDFKEPQISEEKRLDVVITYLTHKYIAELKVWYGDKAHQNGLLQLADYLDVQQLSEGYLLIFDHSGVKKWHSEWITVQNKRIFAVWV
jgi:energy-coupling factor transporter ATP-binding protein EcfA2